MISLNEHLTPALSPLASDANAEREAEVTLAIVRELSERWHHRPAPKKLLCRPFHVHVPLKPIPLWKQQLRLIQLAQQISADLVTTAE